MDNDSIAVAPVTVAIGLPEPTERPLPGERRGLHLAAGRLPRRGGEGLPQVVLRREGGPASAPRARARELLLPHWIKQIDITTVRFTQFRCMALYISIYCNVCMYVCMHVCMYVM